MHAAILAALTATFGFASGDIFTALLARRVSGRSSMLLLSVFKLLLYVPFIILWRQEFASLDSRSLAWIVPLGVVFTAANLGFNVALQIRKDPALVGVIAGCFPAVSSFIAIVFLGQRPSGATIALLITVLMGVILIGLPEKWLESLKPDKGIALALVSMVCWGIFAALLNEPIKRLQTPHAWFVVQAGVSTLMALVIVGICNRRIPSIVQDTIRKKAWKFLLPSGIVIALAEAMQALALSKGETVATVALLGSYPAAYFLIAHKVFREPLHTRQWVGIALAAIAIVLLSVNGVRA